MESRKDARSLTFLTGKILAPAPQSAIDCAVLNVSRSGACILVPDGAVVSEPLALEIDRDARIRNCKVAWRDGSRIGLIFDGLE